MDLTKKQFKFKGMTLEELKVLDVREFAKLLRSRQKRFLLRNFQKMESFIKRAQGKIANGKKVKTHFRDLIIVPELVGMRIQIYNGNNFVKVDVEENMLGHKFGEFSPTRAKIKHTKAGVGATKGSKHKSKK